MVLDQTLLLVGCGKMGRALLAGWLSQGFYKKDVIVVEPFENNLLQDQFDVRFVTSPDELEAEFIPDIIVFAIKPQAMDDIVPLYGRFVRPETLFISIGAGKPSKYFELLLTADACIIRSMPNTPAAVGRGITVAYKNANVSKNQKSIATKLLEAVGQVGWVDRESLIDGVTAVSGSGPAYVFLLIECLTNAAIKVGLDPDLSEQLARATVAGSGELARTSNESAKTLRENVTSPGGTTAAALEILMGQNGLQQLISAAVIAAEKRSQELAE